MLDHSGVNCTESLYRVAVQMADVNVTELRQNLPAYLERARKGQRIRVTSRGHVIAELGPPSAAKDDLTAARARLRGSVLRYDDPCGPVLDRHEWDMER